MLLTGGGLADFYFSAAIIYFQLNALRRIIEGGIQIIEAV
jgi:hypothetical protein